MGSEAPRRAEEIKSSDAKEAAKRESSVRAAMEYLVSAAVSSWGDAYGESADDAAGAVESDRRDEQGAPLTSMPRREVAEES